MRRQILICLFALFVLAVSAVDAAPAEQQRQVQITSPEINQQVRGVVPIVGSASLPDLQFYKVEFGVGPSPTQWVVIGSLREKAVVNGQLEAWDTTGVPDGVYTLRLQAVRKDGNFVESVVRGITVGNQRPAPSTTPTVSRTPLGGISAPTTPTSVITPQATSTVKILAPTAPLAQPSPTPTISRPKPPEKLPIEPRSWGQAFCFGAAAMGTVFVLLGIVFGLRRLL